VNSISELDVVSLLTASRKYRHVSVDVLLRIARSAIPRARNAVDAAKIAKRKLHQVYGAFFENVDFRNVDAVLDGLSAHPSQVELVEAAKRILALHASTAERLGYLSEFYAGVFNIVGTPNSILDIGCGLNPFALPSMGLVSGVEYHAVDMDRRLTRSLNAFFECCGLPSSAYTADVLTETEWPTVDVVFLLKLLPTLEQQEKGAGIRLLQSLPAKALVVSFPLKSLGGRNVGMEQHYEDFMGGVCEQLPHSIEQLSFEGESVYILSDRSRRRSA